MTKSKLFTLSAALLSAIFFAGCSNGSSEASEPFSGIQISAEPTEVLINKETKITASYYANGKADSSKTITLEIASDTSNGAKFGTASKTTVTSGESATLKAGSAANSAIVVNATCESYSAKITITTYSNSIAYNDRPTGFAATDWNSTAGASNKIVTVSTASDLKQYASAGGYVIYVNGMIDMSEGLLPSSGSSSTASTSKMNAFVAENSDCSTYSEWLKKYSNASTTDNTSTLPISNTYKNKITINVASNTTIIGSTSTSGTRGGTFSIKGKSNVVLRNLVIRDGCDPFPHHEKNDGWNAQHDNIGIESSSNVWIDHCTLEDTLSLGSAANGEKWQIYDGLCDIKGSSKNITVSYTKFSNHDKTMLIGSSDSDGSNSTRTITLNNNYFYNCGQRLPMVRNSKIHIYNNCYTADSNAKYNQQYAVGVRAGSLIIAENNYFSGISYAFKDNYGKLYESGNEGKVVVGSSTVSAKPFSVPYAYSLAKATSSLSGKAGAGKLSVSK